MTPKFFVDPMHFMAVDWPGPLASLWMNQWWFSSGRWQDRTYNYVTVDFQTTSFYVSSPKVVHEAPLV